MHDVDFDHFHATPEQAEKLSEAIWRIDNVELITVGIDIGSTTSHFMISRVHLQRAASNLSSRFIVAARDEIWRSPVLLTPYREDYSIDDAALGDFIRKGYAAAGVTAEKIDTGAVILTGEALKRTNARAIANLFAADAGKFVCASAGHHLECILAAQGSGAVALSQQRKKNILNIDIGGGTTKFALIRQGEIVSTTALAVGGRLLAVDANRRIVRLEQPARDLAASLGVGLQLGMQLDQSMRATLADAMRGMILSIARQETPVGIAAALTLIPALAHLPKPDAITFSGGVAEFLFGRETADFGDLGRSLAESIKQSLGGHAFPAEIWDPGRGIRATVAGASQFTVQVSGNTILLSSPQRLPLRNLPVVSCPFDLSSEVLDRRALAQCISDALIRHDLQGEDTALALAFKWHGTPSHARLYAVADAVVRALPVNRDSSRPLVLMIDGDIAKTLGRIINTEIRPGAEVISIDGLQLRDFDFVDIGERIGSAGVVPVVIKSLLFPAG
ncbi:MAG: reactivating factor for ethanolamine ammonia lyase [Betaproteobacteria bacterium]|nr:reactivating factor for ethanolamine ammonia lyase [Betaproteobacteria bacterium]